MLKQKSFNSLIRMWFLIQYFLEIAIIGILLMRRLLGVSWQNKPLGLVLTTCIFLLILTVPGVFLLNPHEAHLNQNKRWQQLLLKFNHYYQTLGQLIVLPTLLSMLCSFLPTEITIFNNLILSLILIYSLIMYIPIGVLAFARIQSLLGRMLMSLIVAFLMLSLPLTGHTGFDPILLALSNSDIMAALSFVILTSIVMKIWGFELPKFSWAHNSQKGIILFLIIFSLITIIFNAFGTAESWQQILQLDFTIRSTSLTLLLNGLEAGILEEWLCRFVLLYLLLHALRNRLFQFDLAIIGSSLIFSLAHIPNLAVQSLDATILQAIFAFSLGILFAAIYLYTKAFWWPMLFHASMDILAFITSGKETMSIPTSFDWMILIITAIIFLGIAAFLLSGQRRETVKENFPELL
ncbi:MAG: CPBP family intramembrane metalloprotease [Lactobacillus sp.]|uniref:CPBP family intramembrane glutamic endopeptidase n=1 Tax=Bombilactobacillus bombi TaxID=1303590 RepID=UPI0035E5A028|nr:CPBP family intramembrane metalloprotease [Lactobacillus sp.]